MTERKRSDRTISRRGLFAAGGVMATSTVFGARAAGHAGDDLLYVPVKLVEALAPDAAVVELLESGERILVQTVAGASITEDGGPTVDGFRDYEPDDLLLVAATSPPADIDSVIATGALNPILDPIAALERHIYAQFMTTIVIGGSINVPGAIDEVDGLADEATSLVTGE